MSVNQKERIEKKILKLQREVSRLEKRKHGYVEKIVQSSAPVTGLLGEMSKEEFDKTVAIEAPHKDEGKK